MSKFSIILLFTILALVMNLAAPAQTTDEPTVENKLGNPANVVDRLFMLDSAEAWEKGELTRLKIEADGKPLLVLDDTRERGFPKSGRYVSHEVEAEFPFTELLPSWNCRTPDNTGFIFEVRVRDAASRQWSPYLYMGQWGRTVNWPGRVLKFDHGVVHTDFLNLDSPADAFQFRVSFQSFDFQPKRAALRRVSASYSGVVSDPEKYAALKQSVTVPELWARSLPVPFYAQGNLDRSISGSTCSPTSVSMVMAYNGVVNEPVENALRIYDPEYGIFGNWARSAALPAEYGMDTWVRRFRGWDQVKAEIAEGHALIASIRFNEGDFPSNPMRRTGGHLIVIRGFTPEGDVIVNDPAHREQGNGIVYKAEELGRAWFDKGGVSYMISSNKTAQ